MNRLGIYVLVAALAVASAAGAAFVRGSVTAGIGFPVTAMPYADAWAKEIDFDEEDAGHAGALGGVGGATISFALGYGVSLGDYFRFDAAVENLKYENSATFTYSDADSSYRRDVVYTTHVVPVHLTGTFFAPAFMGGRVKPGLGLGVAAFIAEVATYQEFALTFQNQTDYEVGNAWARDIAFGPEIKVGAEVEVLNNLMVEVTGTYRAAEATYLVWERTGGVPLVGPAREDFTGWGIYVGPRYYF